MWSIPRWLSNLVRAVYPLSTAHRCAQVLRNGLVLTWDTGQMARILWGGATSSTTQSLTPMLQTRRRASISAATRWDFSP